MSKIFLKLFFPSWRFFDQVEYEIHLEVRSENLQAWQKVTIPFAKASMGQLFFNPINNLRLQQLSTIEGLAQAVQAPAKASSGQFLRLYQEVLEILRTQLPNEHKRPHRIQFRLVAVGLSNLEDRQIIYISDFEAL